MHELLMKDVGMRLKSDFSGKVFVFRSMGNKLVPHKAPMAHISRNAHINSHNNNNNNNNNNSSTNTYNSNANKKANMTVLSKKLDRRDG